jgi:hypothetical protein
VRGREKEGEGEMMIESMFVSGLSWILLGFAQGATMAAIMIALQVITKAAKRREVNACLLKREGESCE